MNETKLNSNELIKKCS